jgi:hypothetical protein
MKTSFKIFTVIFFFHIGGAPLWAQSEKYVVSAELRISLTHQLWPDVFLNGHPIVDSQDHVFDPVSNIDQRFSKDQLCYFTSTNCLAIRVPQTLGSTAGTNATIGLAYFLKVVFSDHTVDWIVSGQGKARWYHVKKNGRDPSGWTIAGFEDDAWAAAKTFKPVSMAVTLINPRTRAAAKYFPTFQDNANVYSTLGERMLFRKKFNMELTAPPGCGEPAPTAPQKVKPTPSPTWTPQPTSTFTPYANGNDKEPLAQPSLASRLVVSTQVPTATLQPTWTPPARPTLTPTPVWTQTLFPTPRPRIRLKPTRTFTSTPTLFIPRNTPTRLPTRTPLVIQKKWPTATATFTPTLLQGLSIATTIVFDNSPVNIDASFADGPGLYKLEIVDSQGIHLNTLYNKSSGFEKEIWITWDGANDQGQLMRYGHYYALFTKDGVLIQKIALIWIRPGTTGNSAD